MRRAFSFSSTSQLHDNCFTTGLYEKSLQLFLYIPASSAHPPGILPGVVYGTLFRIQTLCSDQSDRAQRTTAFYKRLLARGYQPSVLDPLFAKAIARAQQYEGPSEPTPNQRDAFYYHVRYHPSDPGPHLIQQAWKHHVASPPFGMPMENIKNPMTKQRLGIRRLIVAYSRPMNLGNMLTHRNLSPTHNGRRVSSYYVPT